MKFRHAKLSKDKSSELLRVKVGQIRPFDLMVAPVYVFLKLNQKFVALKGPLGFFTPPEITRLKPMEAVYLPEFIRSIIPFQRAGKEVRRLLTQQESASIPSSHGATAATIPMSAHRLSREVLKTIGPLWRADGAMEPFFIFFLTNEICGQFDPATITRGFEIDVERLELAVLRSAVSVFLALHLGGCDRSYLTNLRLRTFELTLQDQSPSNDELLELLWRIYPNLQVREVCLADFEEENGVIASKFRARLKKVVAEMVPGHLPVPSVYGKAGICDES